jgi:hypothetical protein
LEQQQQRSRQSAHALESSQSHARRNAAERKNNQKLQSWTTVMPTPATVTPCHSGEVEPELPALNVIVVAPGVVRPAFGVTPASAQQTARCSGLW